MGMNMGMNCLFQQLGFLFSGIFLAALLDMQMSLFKLYIYIYIIIQRVETRVVQCPHQLLTSGDHKVSVTQDGTATTFATGQGI